MNEVISKVTNFIKKIILQLFFLSQVNVYERKYSMFKLFAKLKTSGNALKYTANIIFLSISCLLIANLLIQLSDEGFIKTIFVILAIGLDIFRQYVVALAKFYWRKSLVKSCALWFVYIIHVSVVLIASVGFSLSAIDTKVKSSEVYNLQKQAIIDNINSNEAEIKKMGPLKETLNPNSEQYKLISQRIDALQKVDRGLFEQLKGFAEVKVNVQNDVYDTLGKALRIDGGLIKLYMLLVISSLIELALLITSWDIKINQDISIQGVEQNPEMDKNEIEIPDTKLETQNQTFEIKKKICPVCQKAFTYQHENKVFCSPKCRLKSYRANLEQGVLINKPI